MQKRKRNSSLDTSHQEPYHGMVLTRIGSKRQKKSKKASQTSYNNSNGLQPTKDHSVDIPLNSSDTDEQHLEGPEVDAVKDLSPSASSFFRSYGFVAVILLSLCYLWGIAAFFIQISTSGFVAVKFAGDSLGTVPVGLSLAASAMFAGVVPTLHRKLGLRVSFNLGLIVGTVGALLNMLSTYNESFALLCIGAFFQGMTYAYTYNLRFLVLSFTPKQYASRAIALVISGATISVIGPELSQLTKNSFAYEYMGSYLSNAAFYIAFILTFNLLLFRKQLVKPAYRLAKAKYQTQTQTQTQSSTNGHDNGDVKAANHNNSSRSEENNENSDGDATSGNSNYTAKKDINHSEEGNHTHSTEIPARSLWELISQPRYMVACMTCAVSFAGMAGLMNATPLAMKNYGHSFSQTTSALQIHMVGMFLPAIITGDVISFFGNLPVIYFGMVNFILGCGLYYIGETYAPFTAAYFFIGTGWSFGFVGGTRFLTTTFRNNEQAKAVAFNEAVMLGSVTLLVMVASTTLSSLGWHTMLYCYLALFILALVLINIYHVFYHNPDDVISSTLPSHRPSLEPIGSTRGSFISLRSINRRHSGESFVVAESLENCEAIDALETYTTHRHTSTDSVAAKSSISSNSRKEWVKVHLGDDSDVDSDEEDDAKSNAVDADANVDADADEEVIQSKRYENSKNSNGINQDNHTQSGYQTKSMAVFLNGERMVRFSTYV